MALDYGFFNGIDRKYDAIQLSRMFDGIINDGVFATVGKQFEVKHVNELLVTVGVGRAWFRHIWSANDTLYPIYLDPAETVIDRFDAIVLETDLINRTAAIKYLKGVPSSSAVEPEYSDTQTLHQAPLAVIFRKAGSTSISQLDISNKVGTSKCPLVTAVNPTVTTESMIANWEIEFDNWMTGRQKDFNQWMLSQQELFDTWMGGEKASFGIWVNTVKSSYADWFNSTKTGLAITTEKIDNFKLGGRNLILGSGSEISTSNYPTRIYQLSEKMIESKIYTIKVWGSLGTGKTNFDICLNNDETKLGTMVNNRDGTFTLVFRGKASGSGIENDRLRVCPMPIGVGGVISTIKKIKLESGNQETDWTPAPEDVEEYTNTKALEAQNAATEYALAKAELARIEAETHADGLVSEEEQARINDATEKLNQAKTYAETKALEAQNAAVSHADNLLNTYASSMNNKITDLQNQIDGSITTWFYAVPPTLLNEPAKDWNTVDLKNAHLGDLYYDTLTGYSYRWQVINNVYSWQILTDTDVTKALADAAKAQDTADGKRRVFSSTPTVPYDINDLWVQGSGGDIMRCVVSKSTGSYNAADWTKASKYTDDNRAILAEANAKTYAETQATTAEASAKAYADTKKAEAEAASKAYSDAQIALEKVRADAYSDSVLTEAEAYAIEQAEIKLNQAKTYAETKASEAQNAAKKYTDGVLSTFATTMNGTITNLQNQIDGSITTWFYAVPPTTSNTPASTWTTTDLKNIHLGDLYYDTLTGYSYRWQVVNNVYSWVRLTDTDVTKALADAAKAQDTADGKRRVFGAQPVPPYDINDLWVQGTTGDIMRCTTTRKNGVYIAGDWTKASKYTDDSKVNALEIGGRNLLRNSACIISGIYDYAVRGSGLTMGFCDTEKYSTYNSLKTEWAEAGEMQVNEVIIRVFGIANTLSSMPGILGGRQITMSFYAKSSTPASLFFRMGYGSYSEDKKVTINNEWKLYTVSPTGGSVSGVLNNEVFAYCDKPGTVYLSKIKIEFGNKATDWTPAPEDVNQAIYEKALLAENNAKAYSETKATEARTAAEAVAIAQANLAISQSKAYADGIIDAEEAARIAQDTATLNAAKEDAATKASAAELAAKQHSDLQLSNFSSIVTSSLDDLQTQVDGKVMTWFYAAVPTSSNEPESLWTTDDIKHDHLGDLYYNTSTGQAYRYKVTSTPTKVYSWELITDSRITTALTNASKAQDTADGKRRVFSSTPTVPYDINDLWVQGTTGDIMRCTTAKAAGTTYAAGDWTKASKYTDDTVANTNLATAKTYAETKATEAKTAAQSYALAQAQLAQTQAEAHADGVVSAEEQARIDQATANLATAKTYAETKANEAKAAANAYSDTVQQNAQSYAQGLADNLQTQVDGKIETFAQTADPSTAWTTTALKTAHTGDLWYHTTSKITKIWSGTAWTTMEDATANNAQALAQTKNKIFTATPTIPYIVGDLWVQGTTGDIMRCATARASGSYTASDWVKAAKYTDDARAIQAEANAKVYADNLKTAIDADISAVETSVTNLDNEINTTFKDGVIQEAEAKAIEKYLNTVNAEKADLDSRYTKIYGDADLTGTPKTDLASKKTAYNTAHTNLINSINTAITDGKTTPTEKADVDTKFTAYRTALSNLSTSFETAIRAIEQRKVDNIQVGGRNLIIDFSMVDGWISNTGILIGGAPYKTTLYIELELGKDYIYQMWNNSTGTSWWTAVYFDEENNYKGGYISQYLPVGYTQKIINTDNYPGSTKIRVSYTHREGITQKLEKGGKATDWTPAPEDVNQAIYEKALLAESNAKTYADTKKSEAEAASKAYADAQINLEKTRADAYADGVLTDAEQYALTQAEAKRDEAKAYAATKAAEAQNASKAYTDGQLNTFATTVNNSLDSLQDQIDGSITTWFYGVPPTTSNAPANTWTTTDLKNNHLGDLYYDTVTGYSYRWQVINNAYSWQRITDTDVTKALSDAAKAQDTADGKRRVFSSQPVPPYDVNDLWVQGTSGDIMRCTVGRTTGVYVASDWIKASKYTDDTRATQAEANAKAYVNALEIGGRNLLLESGVSVSNTSYPIQVYKMTERMAVGKTYTIKVWGTLGAGKTAFAAFLNGGSVSFGQLVSAGDGTFSLTFTGKDSGVTTGDYIHLYPMPSSVTGVTSTIEKIKLEKGGKATDWTPAPEDVDNYTDNAFNQLSQTLTSAINQSKTDIRSEVSEKYYTKGDAAQLVSNMATEFVQTKNEFNFTFTQFTNNINTAIGDANQQLIEIVKYIRFENGDIVLGEVGNELILKIQHDKISFMQGGIEVAYFSNRKLYVTDGEYINSLKVGKYSFFPRANGNLSFKKVVQ